MSGTLVRAAAARLRGLALASHPAPAAVVTALAAAMAAALGSGAGRVALVALAVGAGQLSVGWSNDWLDAGRDRAVGRTDKPVVAGLVTPELLRRGAVVAVVVCALASLATGLLSGLAHLGAVAGAWAYNVRLKSTAWSWAPYAVSFTLLLAFVVLAAPGAPAPAPWALAATALLAVGAHVANTLPDLDDDAATGVRGLPHRLGRRASGVLAPALLLAAVTTVVAGPPGPPAPVALGCGALAGLLAAGAGVVAATRPRSRAPFTLSLAVAVVCVVLLALAVPDVVA
jgi:4-hydroxybenzoate polyprenyltransferase